MASLLAVGLHLSIQQQAQQQAEQTILQWGSDHHIRIAAVRYHLLRNALILNGVDIERADDSLQIDHLLLRANPAILTSQSPRIASIEVAGARARLIAHGDGSSWQSDIDLQRLWQAARHITLRNGSLTLHEQIGSPALQINDIAMVRDGSDSTGRLSADGELDGARIHLSWHQLQRDEQSAKLAWEPVANRPIAEALGLTPLAGELGGKIEWHNRSGEEELSGELAMQLAEEQRSTLRLHGYRTTAGSQYRLQLLHWPLLPWRHALPGIGDRLLNAGYASGELQWHASADEQRIDAEQLRLEQLSFARTDDEQHADWQWQELQLEHVTAMPRQRQIHIGAARLKNGSIDFELPSPSPAEPRQTAWRIRIDEAQVEEQSLQFSLPRGRLRAEHLAGGIQMNRHGRLAFAIETQSGSEQQHGKLQLRGTIEHALSGSDSARFAIRGEEIPAAHLRALLPLRGSENTPLTLEGDAGFNIEATVQDGTWQLQGEAEARNFTLAHGGDSWSAERVESRFGPVGMGLDRQHIDSIHAEAWHYITALHPMPPHRQAKTESAPPALSWWAENLLTGGWTLDRMHWEGGRISVGNADAEWGKRLDLRLQQIAPAELSRLELDGNIGEGTLHIAGNWQPLQPGAPFSGEAQLKHALPFFLNDWLQSSGMPRFTRGRISADIVIKPGETTDSYESDTSLTLRHPLITTETGSADPIPERFGVPSTALLQRLDDGHGTIALQWHQTGTWQQEPLNSERLEQGIDQAINSALTSANASPTANEAPRRDVKEADIREETRVRLHQRATITFNENIRLGRAVRRLQKQPGRIIELVPTWPGETPDQRTAELIRFTQQLVTLYLSNRNIAVERIYPLLPTTQAQSSDLGAIIIRSRPAP